MKVTQALAVKRRYCEIDNGFAHVSQCGYAHIMTATLIRCNDDGLHTGL